MNGTEKIKKMLENQSVDFVGACGWMHTPDVDRKSPEEFVQKVIRLTDENRWDFLKLMNNGSYLPEAYGEDIIFFSENIPLANQKAKRLAVFPNPLIKTENDLTSLPVLDAKSNPVLLRNAKVVQLLVEHYKGSIPVIPTLFTPSATILELCGGNEKLTEFINTCPEKVETAFEALLHSTCSVADLFIEAGADGFFIASKHTSPEMLAPEFFDRFCANFDP